MSATQSNLADRFHKLPRVSKFAAISIGAFALYLFLNDYCWQVSREWTADGDRIQSLLQRGVNRQGTLPKNIEQAAIAFGGVEIPEDSATTSENLAAAVNETMKKHRIAQYGFEALSGGKFSAGAMAGVVGSAERLERLRGEVQFDISPDDVAKILADFEGSPAIDSINSVKIRWLDDKKKVDIKLSTEAWAIAPRTIRRGGGP